MSISIKEKIIDKLDAVDSIVHTDYTVVPSYTNNNLDSILDDFGYVKARQASYLIRDTLKDITSCECHCNYCGSNYYKDINTTYYFCPICGVDYLDY